MSFLCGLMYIKLSHCYLLCVFCTLLCSNYSFCVPFITRFISVSLFCMFYFLFCALCSFVLFCALLLLKYMVFCLLSVYKFTDHCRRVETQM